MEAIVLAGGRGTRLHSVLSDVPKPMAPIAGTPFLVYLLKWLEKNRVSRVVLSVGYMSNTVIGTLGDRYNDIDLEYCVEDVPLGTGGAILKALEMCGSENVVVVNGDTFFDIDLAALHSFHISSEADVTIASKELYDVKRSGCMKVLDGVVIEFDDRRKSDHSLINGGVYVLRSTAFNKYDMPDVFSFESDFLAMQLNSLKTCAMTFNGFFIDIGVPEDYKKAQSLLPKWVEL